MLFWVVVPVIDFLIEAIHKALSDTPGTTSLKCRSNVRKVSEFPFLTSHFCAVFRSKYTQAEWIKLLI